MADISARQNISPLYLEQLLIRLRHHRLVESVRGPGGGYCLSRLPDEISVADIIRAVNEPIDATRCQGKLNCQDGTRCMTHELWDELNGVIEDYLTSVNLARLVARQEVRNQEVRNADAQPLKFASQRQHTGSKPLTHERQRS